jgi:peptidoglycan/LPS O-acetylase OafA/YrhL
MRIHSLDGLRAICISLVLLAHLSGTQHFPRSPLLEAYANPGVRIFFVLSGYLITSMLLKERERNGRISLRSFYLRRGYRIFPAAYVFMLAVIYIRWSALSAANILTALTYTLNYYHRGNWVLGHLWSLGVEEQFYFLWPACLVLFFPSRITIIATVIAGGPPLRLLFWLAWGRAGLEHPFPVFMDALAAGSALCLLGPVLDRARGIFSSRWFLLVCAATAFLPLVQLWNSRLYQFAGVSVFHVGVALSLKHIVTRRYAVLNLRPVAWLGGISYSLYLWQQPFLDRTSSAPWTSFPGNVMLALLLATASFYLVERPFLKLRENQARKRHLGGGGERERRPAPEDTAAQPRPAVGFD